VQIIIIDTKKKKRRLAVVLWTFGPVREQSRTGPLEHTHMVEMSDSSFVEGTVKPQTKRGKPAQVQAGSVVFASSDEAIIKVEQNATNELGVKISAVSSGAAR